MESLSVHPCPSFPPGRKTPAVSPSHGTAPALRLAAHTEGATRPSASVHATSLRFCDPPSRPPRTSATTGKPPACRSRLTRHPRTADSPSCTSHARACHLSPLPRRALLSCPAFPTPPLFSPAPRTARGVCSASSPSQILPLPGYGDTVTYRECTPHIPSDSLSVAFPTSLLLTTRSLLARASSSLCTRTSPQPSRAKTYCHLSLATLTHFSVSQPFIQSL